MIIYDLPHPILSAIPRPHLLQLQAATVREETHRNAKYCSAGAHALSARCTRRRSHLLFRQPVLRPDGVMEIGTKKKKKRKERKSNLQKKFCAALTYTEKCLVGWGWAL